MSGVSGSNRISRENFDKVLKEYEENILKKIPEYISVHISGSYNSDKTKTDFGDMDLIVLFDTDLDKKDFKKYLVSYFTSLPDNVILPFTSEKYKGKRYYNSGEIVTVSCNQPDGSVQIDNIIALSLDEVNFKNKFLDLPAEKQGLILGLVKIALQEDNTLLKKLNINAPRINENEDYEFNLSSVELQLRAVKTALKDGKIKQISSRVLWSSKDWDYVEKIINIDLKHNFDYLIEETKNKVRFKRSLDRIVGLFKSMVTVKSGEIGKPKGINKTNSIKKVECLLGE
jgi:hypothetical protein